MSTERERPPGLASPGAGDYSARYAKRTTYPPLPRRGADRLAVLTAPGWVVGAGAYAAVTVLAAAARAGDALEDALAGYRQCRYAHLVAVAGLNLGPEAGR